MLHEVAGVDDLRPGEMRPIRVAGRELVLCRSGERAFHALSGTCPHRGGPLAAGVLSGTVTSDAVGQYEYTRRNEILHCPWHGYEFDVLDGQPLVGGNRLRVKTYATRIEGGRVYVDDGRD